MDIGLYGLAVMGQNFALNMASKGFKVSVCNRSAGKVTSTVERAKAEGDLPLFGFENPQEFVLSLSVPRKIVMLVQAGQAVDDTIELLSQYMESGDVIIDGGNEWYTNSIRRAESLSGKGIMYIGMGISGGESGARTGPSLMPGGPLDAYKLVEPIFLKSAAQLSEGACIAYMGPIGSGNYVKMVHNGIEYGEMQLIAEIYDILRNAAGLTNGEIAQIFKTWNDSELSGYLVDITSVILEVKDPVTGEGYLVDKILDKTGMKGTGRWTIQEGAERNVAIPTLASSLDVRYMSAIKEERVKASLVLRGMADTPNVDRSQIIEDCKDALYASKICAYAQGLNLIGAASSQMNWNVNLSECARIWQSGCIIRGAILNKVRAAYAAQQDLSNLLINQEFATELNRRQGAWRRIVSLSIACGITSPSLSASLSYFDTYRRARLPANITQAQRDFFGGHSFERTDQAGLFHAKWTESHHDIGDVKERVAGNL